MADARLPQEFQRELALTQLEDALGDLPKDARERYRGLFDQRRADPLNSRGILLVGAGGLRPLMALMRLVVLRFRDINLERFEVHGSEGRLLSAYIRGENLKLPLPERASALFIERADRVDPEVANTLLSYKPPIFATWEGSEAGPVWQALTTNAELIRLS